MSEQSQSESGHFGVETTLSRSEEEVLREKINEGFDELGVDASLDRRYKYGGEENGLSRDWTGLSWTVEENGGDERQQPDVDEASYRVKKAARCIRRGAIPNANAALVRAWEALGEDSAELAKVIEGDE